MYVFHPHGALLVVTVYFLVSPGTNMDQKKFNKNGEGYS
jgi:hypothetical protein